jgi:hypothetical protein
VEKEEEKDAIRGVEVLLQLLGRSLCQRSGSFLESTLHTIEVCRTRTHCVT